MGFINNARKKIENNVNTIPISNQNNEPIITKNEVKNNNIETNNEIKQKIENNNHNEINNNDITNNDSQNKNIQNNNLKIYTDFDKVIDFLTKLDGKAKINEINQILGSNSEYVLKILEKQNIIKIKYPINLFSEPSVILNIKPTEIRDIELPKDKELNDSYILDVDGVTSIVNIWLSKKEEVPIYELITPKINIGTEAFINYIIKKLAKEIPYEETQVKDSSKYEEFKINLIEKIKTKIKTKINLSEEELSFISGRLYHNMFGLGDLEIILGDNWLEEVAINGSNVPVSVFHKRIGWTKTNYFIKNEEDIYNLASQIGRKIGRQINSLNPLMDANLITGDRIAATLKPISTSGNTMTIRRFSRNPWTIIHMIDPKVNTMSIEIAAFLWLCIQYELNILVAGGTASGKTSVLNSVCSLIPSTQRIISIEDTREISLPNDLHWNWVPLSSRKPNPEGQGGVSMLDLMVESLRMRPDRIIVGEVRRKEQAETLFETMHTGHSVYTTLHADTVEQVERRLIEPPIEIPKSEVGALQLIIIQYRDRRKGARRTLEVAEVLSQETDEKSLGINYLFRWKPRTDTFEKINDSIRVMEDLNLHTGMTAKDIEKNLKEREKILEWMLKYNVKDVDLVGKIMKVYYKSPEVILNLANKNLNPEEFFK
jgi:archaeal flagellar protein FlaI